MRLASRFLFLAAFVLFLTGEAQGQDYPAKAIRLVVPYPPGGVVDITGRLLADQLAQELGGTVVVENKPGAGGTIGAAFVARSPADGYTLLLGGAATHAFAPGLYKSPGVRPGEGLRSGYPVH